MSLRGRLRPEENLREVIELELSFDERQLLMTISANVQKLIDDVQQNSDLVKSVIAGQAIMTKQIADLKEAASVLEAGATASAEDVAGINSSIDALEETNKALGVAVPANTPPAPAVDNPTPTPAP